MNASAGWTMPGSVWKPAWPATPTTPKPCVPGRSCSIAGAKTPPPKRLLRDLIQRGSADAGAGYSARHQLAVVLDQLGHYSEALHWLEAAKALLRRTADLARLERDYERAVRRRRGLLDALTPAEPAALARFGAQPPRRAGWLSWAATRGPAPPCWSKSWARTPDIASFDEPMAFAEEVAEKLAPMNAASALTLKALNALTPAQLESPPPALFPKPVARRPAAGGGRVVAG